MANVVGINAPTAGATAAHRCTVAEIARGGYVLSDCDGQPEMTSFLRVQRLS